MGPSRGMNRLKHRQRCLCVCSSEPSKGEKACSRVWEKCQGGLGPQLAKMPHPQIRVAQLPDLLDGAVSRSAELRAALFLQLLASVFHSFASFLCRICRLLGRGACAFLDLFASLFSRFFRSFASVLDFFLDGTHVASRFIRTPRRGTFPPFPGILCGCLATPIIAHFFDDENEA